jgi:hypothetical protein
MLFTHLARLLRSSTRRGSVNVYPRRGLCAYNWFFMPTHLDFEILQAALIGYQHQLDQINASMVELRRKLKGGAHAGAALAEAALAAPGKKRALSVAARKRIAKAQRKRWAEYHKAKEAPAKKRSMSPAARERIAEATRKRWAAFRAKKAAAQKAAAKPAKKVVARKPAVKKTAVAAAPKPE